MDADTMLKEVAVKLRPAKKDIREAASQLEFVRRKLEEVVPQDVEIGMMGSAAKGTSLASNREIDIFMLIPKRYTHEQMTKLGLEWAKKAMKGEKTEIGYANHPYLKVRRGGFKIDIVPSYKIENARHLGSAVDRSQLHTKYVNARMGKRQQDDVRLLKQFCKTLGVYGAELKVEGFSGYLCELLVLQYGSFAGALEAASKWGERPALDMEGHHAKAYLHRLFDAPLVVIDPVDAKRNVAAVVSRTSMSRFTYASRQFLKKPSREFFFKEKEVHSPVALRKIILGRGTCIIAISFKAPNLVEDILWPQLRKAASLLVKRLEAGEFRPFGHYFWADGKDALILIELMEEKVPAVARRIGPAIWHEKDVEAFVQKHQNAPSLHFEHERIVAVEKRGMQTAVDVLKKAIALGEKIGMPGKFAFAMKKAAFSGPQMLLEGKYLEVASDYFTRRV